MKNLAVLCIAEPETDTFFSVRLAPLYDAVSTRVFPKLAGDRMALKLNGRDDRLGLDDFLAAGKIMGVSSAAVQTACRELTERLDTSVATLRLPAAAQAAAPLLGALVSIIETRSAALRAGATA